MSDDLYLESWKYERGYYNGGLVTPIRYWSDDLCDQEEAIKAAWQKSVPKLSHYQARKLFGILPTLDTSKGQLDKDAIKERADIVEVYQTLHPSLKVIQRGNFITAQCFMHEDSRPSLSLSKEKKMGYCHVCSDGFDIIGLVQKSLDISFFGALKWLSQIYG